MGRVATAHLRESQEHVIVPDGVAVVAGLAVVEAQLLERLAEDVFA